VATVICQSIFAMGIFSLAFNSGSHTNPPPWAHQGRLSRELVNPLGSSDTGVEYAAAGDGTTHTIGLDDNDEND